MAFTNGQVIGRSSRTVQPNSQVVGRYGQKTQPYSQVVGRSSQTVQPCGQAIGRYGQVTQPRSQVVGRYSCVYRNSLFKDHLFVMRMIWQYPERDARLFVHQLTTYLIKTMVPLNGKGTPVSQMASAVYT